jgi:DNA helicase II / ATP-dependent DNA helicase PcrA
MTRRATYPVVLLPPPLRDALESTPALPSYPKPPPQRTSFPADIPPGKHALATLYTLLGLRRQAEDLLAPEHRAAQTRYETALFDWTQEKRRFEEAETAKLTPEILRQHRRNRIAAWLETSLSDRAADLAPLAGKAETHLYEHLCLHFPNRILRRRTLPHDGRAYHPDFLYFDPQRRLRIDIELDEPYALRTKLPIHFVDDDGTSEDDRRDYAFLEAGWVVIRFSESQAVEDAPGCARVVADLIEKLTGERTPSLETVPAVVPHPRWTRFEANAMVADETRTQLTQHLEREEVRRPPPKPQRTFTPSPHQQQVFDFLEHDQGHGLIVAVAGSGKTTTLVEAVRTIKRVDRHARVAMLAFNRPIRAELQARIAESGFDGVETRTLNGFGMSVLRRRKQPVSVQYSKTSGMLNKAATQLDYSELKKEEFDRVSTLFNRFLSYIHVNPDDPAQFDALAQQYNLPDMTDFQPLIVRALKLSVERYLASNIITLEEQNYLPVKLELELEPYDYVFVDECQDLTQTQLELVRRAAGEHGRLLFVGDPRQAIMGFRGADNASIDNIAALDPPPKPLELSVSYRCPNSHVRKAQALMPAITAAPNAPEGEIFTLGWTQAFEYVRERDLLITKSNLLVKLILLELLARGFTLDYDSRDLKSHPGEEDGAEPVVRPLAQVLEELRKQASSFDPKRAPRRRPMFDKDRKEDALEPFYPWVLARWHEGLQAWDGESFPAFVTAMTAPDSRLGVRVCTAHRAKGLEAHRVFVMDEASIGELRQEKQLWERQQEENLRYVALTRAKETLYLVGSP